MIPVSRPQEPPTVLKKYANKWLLKLQQAINNLKIVKSDPAATQKQITKAEKDVEKAITKYRHKKIKESLENIFNGKCAYCESQVTTTGYGDIEHFCPKGIPRCVNLTFEWSNLLLSCEKCNDAGHKGTNFPLDTTGNPILIDPTDDQIDINEHLQFSWDLVDGARVEGIDARGKEVERIFDLNSERGTRKELFKHRTQRVEDILTVLVIAKNTGDPKAIQLLLQYCQPSSEYSAFALVHILPHLAHDFRDPEAIALLEQISRRSPAYAALVHVKPIPLI